MSSGTPSREEIERGISRIFDVVLSTKNITARYIVILALASLFLDAYDFTAIAYGLDSFKATFPWMPAWLFGLAVSAIQIGAVIGSVIGGWLTDRVGRRAMFIINMILFVAMAAAAGLAPDPYTFTVFRTLLGFALGADTATGFTYIFEYLERQQRLAYSNSWMVMWYGSLIFTIIFIVLPTYFIVHSFTNPLYWRIIMFIGAALAAIILAFRSKIPESILWEAYKGHLATAKRILKNTYGIDLPDVPDVNVELRQVARSITHVFKIFKRKYWKQYLWILNSNFEQAVNYYAFGFYSVYILLSLHLAGPLATIEASSIYFAAGLIGGLAAALLVNRFGTRNLFLLGTFLEGGGLVLLALTYLYHLPLWLFVLWAVVYFFGHNSGPVPNPNTAMGAIHGPSERGTAMGWSYFMVKLGAAVSAFIAPMWLAAVGFTNLTLVLGAYSLASAFLGLAFAIDVRKIKPPELEETAK